MKRVRVTWNRSQSPFTKYYEVYRSTKMNITTDNLDGLVVMRVAHPSKVNPVKIEDEETIRQDAFSYALEHKRILLNLDGKDFDFTLYVDGVPYDKSFTLDTDEGTILFIDEIDAAAVMTASYTFDGVEAFDYAVEEEGKEYYGPEAKDTMPPTVPNNVAIFPEYNMNRIKISWDASDVAGTSLYYRVRAFEKEKVYSKLSNYRSIAIIEPLADRPYIIEKSLDGKLWKAAAQVQYNEYFDYLLDHTAPNPLRDPSATQIPHTIDSFVDVILKWKLPYESIASNSPRYRVRAKNKMGYTSKASNVVGPIPFDTPLDRIVIRRKEKDGTLPTFDGADAITVATVDASLTSTTDVVDDNKSYTYAFWVIDGAGNRSIAVSLDIDVDDNSKPKAPTNLAISKFSLVVN